MFHGFFLILPQLLKLGKWLLDFLIFSISNQICISYCVYFLPLKIGCLPSQRGRKLLLSFYLYFVHSLIHTYVGWQRMRDGRLHKDTPYTIKLNQMRFNIQYNSKMHYRPQIQHNGIESKGDFFILPLDTLMDRSLYSLLSGWWSFVMGWEIRDVLYS
jgi:hypothetical protein